jgi:hypothetical protein
MVQGFPCSNRAGGYGGTTIGFVVVDRLAKSYPTSLEQKSFALSKCTWGLRPQSSRLKVSNNKRKNKYGS